MSGEEITSFEFVKEQMTVYFDRAKDKLSHFYFAADADREAFHNSVGLSFESERQKGALIPTISKSSEEGLVVKVEPDSLMELSEALTQDTGFSPADVAKLLVGIGVARAMLFFKMPSTAFNTDPSQIERFEEILYDDQSLLSQAYIADPKGEANLVETIGRLDHDDRLKINTLRFLAGISLQHLTDSLPLQHTIAKVFHPLLFGDQKKREMDYKMALVLTEDTEQAEKYYDSTVDHVLIALSFPMSPSETVRLIVHNEDDA